MNLFGMFTLYLVDKLCYPIGRFTFRQLVCPGSRKSNNQMPEITKTGNKIHGLYTVIAAVTDEGGPKIISSNLVRKTFPLWVPYMYIRKTQPPLCTRNFSTYTESMEFRYVESQFRFRQNTCPFDVAFDSTNIAAHNLVVEHLVSYFYWLCASKLIDYFYFSTHRPSNTYCDPLFMI